MEKEELKKLAEKVVDLSLEDRDMLEEMVDDIIQEGAERATAGFVKHFAGSTEERKSAILEGIKEAARK